MKRRLWGSLNRSRYYFYFFKLCFLWVLVLLFKLDFDSIRDASYCLMLWQNARKFDYWYW